MGKLSSFSVKFPGNYDVVFAGGKLAGWVAINVRTEIPVLAVKIAITGRAKTHWFESSKKSSRKSSGGHKMPFDAQEEYFGEEFVLLETPAGQDSVKLPEGFNKFPFEFEIPKSCPSSFESEYGSIRYFLKASIAKQSGFDHIVKKVFTVLAKKDLSKEKVAGIKPLKETKYEGYRTLKLKTGKMGLTVCMPRPGFVPGQYLDLEAEVQIVGDRMVKLIELSLQRLDTFKGKNSSDVERVKSEQKTIASASVEVAVLGGKESQTVDFSNFRIPPLPPALDGCGIISIAYSVTVCAVSNKPNFFTEIKIPITIGTLPFKSTFKRIICAREDETMAARKISQLANPEAVVGTAAALEGLPADEINHPKEDIQLIDSDGTPNQDKADQAQAAKDADGDALARTQTATKREKLPLPTYEDCIFGRRNMIEEDEDEIIYGTVDYAPKYPVYNFIRLADLEKEKAKKAVECD